MIIAALLILAGAQDVPAPVPHTVGSGVTTPARDKDGTQRWSLMPDPCASERVEGELLVCGEAATAAAQVPRLPLPEERGPPDRPMPSNPDVTGIDALRVSVPPCATLSQGCTTGVDLFGGATFLVRAVGKLIDKDSCCEEPGEATNFGGLLHDIGKVFRKKPRIDKSNRVPIPLDDPKPAEPGSATP
ncbi:MAG: hypothetical protein KF730_02220 [Sphingomonas sp.]|uniref:hypothetical protein n=1 Tax=Sphingomonas sp. TaxID=28214 RepID=UPI0025EF7452|nr:hypothetical protein [Sphingomonas sp.]MBX3563370.1 hypothetical protein [Sphingomonas sp.]